MTKPLKNNPPEVRLEEEAMNWNNKKTESADFMSSCGSETEYKVEEEEEEEVITPYSIFNSFIKTSPSGKIDASGIVSKECFDSWVASRKENVQHKEKAFRSALLGHLTGRDRRRPFTPEKERAILLVLRQKKVWPCFEGTDLKIGIYGIRKSLQGFNERKSDPNFIKETKEIKAQRKLKNKTKAKLKKEKMEIKEMKKEHSSVDGHVCAFKTNNKRAHRLFHVTGPLKKKSAWQMFETTSDEISRHLSIVNEKAALADISENLYDEEILASAFALVRLIDTPAASVIFPQMKASSIHLLFKVKSLMNMKSKCVYNNALYCMLGMNVDNDPRFKKSFCFPTGELGLFDPNKPMAKVELDMGMVYKKAENTELVYHRNPKDLIGKHADTVGEDLAVSSLHRALLGIHGMPIFKSTGSVLVNRFLRNPATGKTSIGLTQYKVINDKRITICTQDVSYRYSADVTELPLLNF